MSTFIKQDFDFWKYKAFFCFWDEQFEKAKKENWINDKEKLVNLGAWLVSLKSNYKEMLKAFSLHNETEKERRIKEDGIENIIKYELANYESYYTWDITDAMEALKEYWVSESEVKKVFKEQLQYN